MHGKEEFRNLISRTISRIATAALAIATVFALTVVLTQSAQTQTFNVLYTFTGGADGGAPNAGLTMDRAGNLYGTATAGGRKGGVCSLYYGGGCGTVFRLTNKDSQWVLSTLYSFQGGLDGVAPTARVIFGPDGALYGTTSAGGEVGCPTRGCGTVFRLRPSPGACTTALCPWTETVLHRFNYGSGGYWPGTGDLLIDASGIIYGTTTSGGAYGAGVVFSLTPSQGAWTYSVLYSFTGGNDGASPVSGVISDDAGNLYGTASSGGSFGYGTVYELIHSGSGWQEKTLYSFSSTKDDGYAAYPVGGLIFDGSSNLYGTTEANSFEIGGGGAIFELTPSNGNWTMTHSAGTGGGMDAGGPTSSLVMDAGGNLYGTAVPSALYAPGVVFKVPPDWEITFLGGFSPANGDFPEGSLILDASGNIYGTASKDGADGWGTVWEITP